MDRGIYQDAKLEQLYVHMFIFVFH